ncbi:hypothetical protein [Candidatus Nitrospira neomarina]|uniref:Uncharacterized protein n=1 Tax=Candidatus Nitrospira neomarina TaxID=3020899 RepID=A0AA96GQ06_9BACT|nr:hypothetical protein [Candidatus Nitrospira neomarina]WNM62119.1 hypothetical protein PQG83_20625 [Candidatus Nitrospira neomarina]
MTRFNRKGPQRLVDILDSGQLLEKQAFQEQSGSSGHLCSLGAFANRSIGFLHDFQEEHLIMVHGRELMIINVDRLTKIAGMPLSR